MEGSFSRPYKSERHPHTNMAKASVNMLTRTLGESLAGEKIYINSVDTGWVTDEQPVPMQAATRPAQGFEPPLDVLDGAARVCDLIIDVALDGVPQYGKFLKDYRAVEW